MLLPLTVALFLFSGVALLAESELVAGIGAGLAVINEALVAYARTRVPAAPPEEPTDG